MHPMAYFRLLLKWNSHPFASPLKMPPLLWHLWSGHDSWASPLLAGVSERAVGATASWVRDNRHHCRNDADHGPVQLGAATWREWIRRSDGARVSCRRRGDLWPGHGWQMGVRRAVTWFERTHGSGSGHVRRPATAVGEGQARWSCWDAGGHQKFVCRWCIRLRL